MANRNDNRGSSGHDGNGMDENNMYHWPGGLSFKEALSQPLTREQVFGLWCDQRRPMGMPYGVQGSTSTLSTATESQHNFEASQHLVPLSQTTDPTPTLVRGLGWSIMEDKKLCHAWVKVSTDPIVVSDQKKLSFWKKNTP
ncbi:hypothetical protein Drorol1_Dr00000269 [Drosera rotundifolia]